MSGGEIEAVLTYKYMDSTVGNIPSLSSLRHTSRRRKSHIQC